MKKYKIKNFKRGWFIGDFSPTLFKTKNFEIAMKTYEAGDCEDAHYHVKSTEYTLVVNGSVKFNNKKYSEGDIIKVKKNEVVEFKSITDSVTMVVKIPSSKNDKFVVSYNDIKTVS